MRDRRLFRAFVAGAAAVACLVAPVLWSGALEAASGSHAEVARASGASSAETGHDSCWTAEVDRHQRHEDRRFESQRDLRHHLHVALAWSGAASVQPPGPAIHAVLPRLEVAYADDEPRPRRELDRSPRQSRAPPRA